MRILGLGFRCVCMYVYAVDVYVCMYALYMCVEVCMYTNRDMNTVIIITAN